MTALGLILARGGSKRVPGKNIKMLGGLPLLAWSIAAAIHAQSVDAIVVSSDSDVILDVAKKHGAALIKRPADLATDDASPYAAMLHAIQTIEGGFDHLCLLQPTSPFRVPGDIDGTFNLMLLSGGPAAVSVEAGEKVPNGAVYWCHVGWLVEALALGHEAPFDGPVPVRYEMPKDRSLDIDTPRDWEIAEGMLAPAVGVA